jgi:hypothetical protein
MGGPFSGRWGIHRRKWRVDECRSFTVAALVGDKPPVAGHAARFEWRSRDGTAVLASIRFAFVTTTRVRLDYLWGEAAEPVAVPFDLTALPTPRGGTRYLAVCPLVVNDIPCRRRTARLYLPPASRYFGCRVCHRLSYRSRQGHDKRVTALLNSGNLPALVANTAGLPVTQLALILAAITEHDRRFERELRRFDPKPKPRRRKPP